MRLHLVLVLAAIIRGTTQYEKQSESLLQAETESTLEQNGASEAINGKSKAEEEEESNTKFPDSKLELKIAELKKDPAVTAELLEYIEENLPSYMKDIKMSSKRYDKVLESSVKQLREEFLKQQKASESAVESQTIAGTQLPEEEENTTSGANSVELSGEEKNEKNYSFLELKLNNQFPSLTSFTKIFVGYLKINCTEIVQLNKAEELRSCYESFSIDHVNFTRQAVSDQVFLTAKKLKVKNKPKYDPENFKPINAIMEKPEVLERFGSVFIYDQNELTNQLNLILDEIRRNTLENFEKTLQGKFPDVSDLNKLIVQYFNESNVDFKYIQVTKIKYISKKFTSQHPTQVENAVKEKIEIYLRPKYQKEIYEIIIEEFSGQFQDVNLVYSSEDFQTVADAIEKSIEQRQANLNKLSVFLTGKSIDQSFPAIFVNFLSQTSTSDISRLALIKDSSNFINDNAFKKFCQERRMDVIKLLNSYIKRKYGDDAAGKLTESFKNKFECERLFNERILAPELESEFEKVCKSDVNSKIESLKEEVDRSLYAYLNGNECIPDEICARHIIVGDESLSNEIELYINGHNEKSKDSRFHNKKIRDETDETIYEVVREKLKTTNEKADCIVDFLRRKDLIDAVYTIDLLFDENKMAKAAEEFENEYQNYLKEKQSSKSTNKQAQDRPLATAESREYKPTTPQPSRRNQSWSG